MRFELRIDMANDAMQDEAALARALRRVADVVEENMPLVGRAIRDENGNTVGSFEFVDEEG